MPKFIGGVITAARERASALVIGWSLLLVAVSTGFISYTHISALTVDLGGSWKTAHLMPLAVDGQIAIGSVILMEVKDRRRWLGLAGFVPGLLESLFANWESGIVHGLLAAGWSTVPAQAFACSTFLFEMWLRYRRSARLAAAVHPETITQATGPVAPEAQEAAPAGAPQGLVSPAAAPAPAPAPQLTIPTYGPVMTLQSRPKARPAAVDDSRQPLPGDEDEVRRAVNAMSRNDLWRTYQVSKHKADQLREQYLNEREVA